MFASSVAALALAASLSGVEARGVNLEKRQLNTLSSYTSYINHTVNDASPVTLQISLNNTCDRNETSPLLYGLMHEDINHSGDGGIYAEMIANRAFQGSTAYANAVPGFTGNLITQSENPIEPFAPVITAWGAIGDGVRLTLDLLHPLDALPTSLQVDIPLNATGPVGFENYGWWGFNVVPQAYNVSFYMLNNYPRDLMNDTTFTVSFKSNTTNQTWASTTIPNVPPTFIDFQQINATITPNISAPDANNKFTITMDGAAVAGQTFYFNLISVFPQTFKNYQNGLRSDIADAFYDMKPTFLRCPGGNNIEGFSPAQRWNWRKAIGPLPDRPGRIGNWDYYNTQGLGLMEYLEWNEAMNMKPVLAIYSGFSLDIWGQEGPSYPPDMMHTILQDALDELEFCMGGPNTTYGAMRAAYGHPAPFDIEFVEIGNEDFFSSTYNYRFPYLYNGIKAVYPNITLISTQFDERSSGGYGPPGQALENITIPAGGMYDYHTYQEPSWFVDHFSMWDNWQVETNNTDVTVLLGEYSVIQIDTPNQVVNYSFSGSDTHIVYPRLLSALGESLYLLSAERNPNTVKMSSYAPSLENRNFVNWTPDMISFDALYTNTVKSASYWLQWMFARYRGTQTLPVTNTAGNINPLYWVATIDTELNAVFLKVTNTLNQSIPLTVGLDAAFKSVNGTILTAADLNSYNYINNQTEVVPAPINFNGSYSGAGDFKWSVPKFSVSVLQFDL